MAGAYDARMRRISVVGVPSSAGSYAAGQDQAPGALRSAGLVEALVAAGREVRDGGDLPLQVWRPDRDHPRAQNADQVTDCLRELAERLGPLLADDDMVLVLGGNCTIALAVIAALRRLRAGPPGLLYVDRHYDLNTPQSITDGALDWMGLAHALALPGCVDDLADAFGYLPPGPLAVHIDVDVLDFTDAPLAENTDGRNSGPTLDQAGEALRVAARDPRLRSLSIGELNPTRSAGDPEAIPRFVDVLAGVLAAAAC